MSAKEVLKEVFGYDNFRVGQEKLVEAVCSGRDVLGIMPTLIGLMVAVGILRASGLLEKISDILRLLVSDKIMPPELIPVVFVRLFSNSAATGLVLDIFKNHGTDSVIGKAASILMSSTETVFYTMSVYFMSIHIKKTRCYQKLQTRD